MPIDSVKAVVEKEAERQWSRFKSIRSRNMVDRATNCLAWLQVSGGTARALDEFEDLCFQYFSFRIDFPEKKVPFYSEAARWRFLAAMCSGITLMVYRDPHSFYKLAAEMHQHYCAKPPEKMLFLRLGIKCAELTQDFSTMIRLSRRYQRHYANMPERYKIPFGLRAVVPGSITDAEDADRRGDVPIDYLLPIERYLLHGLEEQRLFGLQEMRYSVFEMAEHAAKKHGASVPDMLMYLHMKKVMEGGMPIDREWHEMVEQCEKEIANIAADGHRVYLQGELRQLIGDAHSARSCYEVVLQKYPEAGKKWLELDPIPQFGAAEGEALSDDHYAMFDWIAEVTGRRGVGWSHQDA